MHLSLQQRALAVSLLTATLSLGGAFLAARSIGAIAGSSLKLDAAPLPPAMLVPTQQLVAQGAQFFGQSCGDCHWDDAHGDEGPDLHNIAISDARIAANIKHGVKGEMPSFARKYQDPQIAALVAYVRSLR